MVSDRIDIENLPDGIYILKVGDHKPVRFVKE
jgi:hypothetical protein